MRSNRIILLLAVIALVLTSAACLTPSLTDVLVAPTREIPATATTAPPQVSPVAEAELANALEGQVVAVYEQAAPAVFNITTQIIAYDFFMRPVPQEGGTASGFVYDDDGHIVTNYHVVENAESVSVSLPNGETYPAEIVGVDPSTDLAVLQIDAEDSPAAIPLGDSTQLRVGQFVLAIGNPFGQEGTLTMGVISALERVIESPDGRFIGEAIQTDAPINPGNSGGPLLDLQGRLIGVTSQIISPVRGSAGIGFAVSSNAVRRVVPQLIAYGRYPHPWLGIYPLELNPERAQLLEEAGMEMPVDEGLLVTEVVQSGPAAAAGIRGPDRVARIGNTRVPLGGDIITAVNGERISSFQELTVYLESQTQVGDTVEVTVIRDGEEISVPVRLTERPR